MSYSTELKMIDELISNTKREESFKSFISGHPHDESYDKLADERLKSLREKLRTLRAKIREEVLKDNTEEEMRKRYDYLMIQSELECFGNRLNYKSIIREIRVLGIVLNL